MPSLGGNPSARDGRLAVAISRRLWLTPLSTDRDFATVATLFPLKL
jgi:hypothetical protein